MIQALRRVSQITCAVAANSYYTGLRARFIYDGPLKGFCVPLLNCYACPLGVFSCPIGSIQHFVGLHLVPFYVIGLLGIVGFLGGRIVCGWGCPFGFFQELMFKLSKVHYEIPYGLEYGRYVILVGVVLVITFITGEPWFCRLCPAGTLTAGIPWLILNPVNPVDGQVVVVSTFIGWLFAVKIVILAGFLALFTVTERPFCRIICPLGAIFSLFNRVSLLQLAHRPTEKCEKCGNCEAACLVSTNPTENINSTQCVRCLKCTKCKNNSATFVNRKVA